MTDTKKILTVNSGSSSIRFSLYRMGPGEQLVYAGIAEGIGTTGALRVRDTSGKLIVDKETGLPGHGVAMNSISTWLRSGPDDWSPDAIGHRLVHGGRSYEEPRLITADVMTALDALVPFAPDHLPHELSAIREMPSLFPGKPQVACFDTAFHRTMPAVARVYALPEDVRQHGVERYGFHGLSYEYILQELKQEEGEHAAAGRVIIAHLGNGASMAAFRNGRSLDTTMGFTPAGGLVMSTRSGDLDPGTIVYLLREKGLDAAAINRIVNKQSGLLGISGTSSDMQALEGAASRGDEQAALAVQLFCYQAKKFLGALAAVLGGIDTLVFTGGIGEHAPSVRSAICEDMEFLGIRIDADRNRENQAIISEEHSRVQVRVMRTNEELMIARHTSSLVDTMRKAA